MRAKVVKKTNVINVGLPLVSYILHQKNIFNSVKIIYSKENDIMNFRHFYSLVLYLAISTAQNPIDNFLTGNNNFVVIGDASNDIFEPRDLDFHPTRENELWVLNKGGTPYSSNAQYVETVCVPENSDVAFTIYDSYGDGICCSYGIGSYDVDVCGQTAASGGNFGSQETTFFNVGVCSDGCNGNEVEVTVTILTDNYGGETSWDLVDDDSGITYGMLAESGGSNVIFFGAGFPDQTSEYRKDSFSGHFMHTASSMSFDNNGFFANAIDCQDGNNNANGYFAGPTLWDADLDIYAVVNQNGPLLGSHLDMLHQSPYGVGIEYAGEGNKYWLFDGFHSAIVKYDFQNPHQYGGDDHSDGRIWRYGEVVVSREEGVPSHMVLDESTDWLYIADTGNSRIIRFNVNSGNFDYNLSPYGEPLAQYWMMENAEWEVVVDQGLQKPSGIDLYEGRLIVGDFATGEIIIYDISGANVNELGRFNTGYENNLMGLVIGPNQNIFYVNYQRNELVRVEGESEIELTIPHFDSWNLVGLPVVTDDPNYQFIFPNAINETLYSFGSGYVMENELSHGVGYWLRFPEPGYSIISGGVFNEVLVSLSEGWNLMSGISYPTSINNIQDTQNIIIAGTIYGWNANYVLADELESGKAYWVRTISDGIVIISDEGNQRNVSDVNLILDNKNTIRFTNINGCESTLHFGVSIPSNELLSYSLPPLPPAGAFDVRFDGDMRAVENGGKIRIQNMDYPMTLSFDLKEDENKSDSWKLVNPFLGEEYILSESGSIEIISPINELFLTKEKNIPEAFTLFQNYPNPFNPITNIEFYLAEESNVSLTIYDLSGKLVKVILDGNIGVGYSRFVWDASDNLGNQVSAGVYLYRIKTEKFVQTNKLILLK